MLVAASSILADGLQEKDSSCSLILRKPSRVIFLLFGFRYSFLYFDSKVFFDPLPMSAGEGKAAVLSAKRWDCCSRADIIDKADLIESATPCHIALVLGLEAGSSPVHLLYGCKVRRDYTAVPMGLIHKTEFLQKSSVGIKLKAALSNVNIC